MTTTDPAPREGAERDPRPDVPLLDPVRVGHVRHIENLAHQLDNEWAHMGARLPFQENFEALRYQIAYMAFAIGLTHFHRLPAAPGYFRSSFRRLVEKMLLPDVWYYWRDTSKGGGAANYDAPRGEGWLNPVDRDNIMFSAYVQSMSAMYHYLFDDDRFTKPGALSFKFEPILFTWDDRTQFVYDENSLNEHIYWRMVESGYLGIACEPYCVFQICNQPAILSFRLHDLLHGTDRATEVTQGWLEAWNQFGLLDENGHFNPLVKTNIPAVQANTLGPWADGWLGSLLNMWYPELVKERYAAIIDEMVIDRPDGTSYVPSLPTPEGETDFSAGSPLDFGWVTAWVSEMGDTRRLGRLLGYADRYFNPTWRDGGYYYPRNDAATDGEGNPVTVSPQAGNALLPYARLNVPDGMWGLYNRPWKREHFAEPLLTEVSTNVDVTRARFLPDTRELVFSLAGRGDRPGDASVHVANAWAPGRTAWTLTAGGVPVARGDAERAQGDGISASRRGDGLDLTLGRDDDRLFELRWSSSEDVE